MPGPQKKQRSARPQRARAATNDAGARPRILEAAFEAFMENGYAAASTLDIATRARVSKRELYALVGNKHEMLVACIQERASRLRVSADLPVPDDRESLAGLLAAFGARIVREVTDPAVMGVFRLAIGEALHAPEVARSLDSIGREATRASLRKIMTDAASSRLIEGRPAELAEQFTALLWGDLMLSSLLGLVSQPNPRDLARRAREAAATFLRLHPEPT